MPSALSAKERERLIANGLAHKIRNSLNTMRAHIALLQKLASPAEELLPRQINKLEEAVVGLEEMVKEFLAFASPAKDDCQEVDLAALVREVLSFAALELEQGRVTVVEDVAAELPKVYVDHGKLEQAILNIVINARQAMPQGGRLTVRVLAPTGGRVALEIRDSGCGIPEEDKSRVFQPFFSTKPGGLGLGLAVAKRTIKDLRGRLGFESRVGQGTVFRILLPTAARQRAALERQARRQQFLQPFSS